MEKILHQLDRVAPATFGTFQCYSLGVKGDEDSTRINPSMPLVFKVVQDFFHSPYPRYPRISRISWDILGYLKISWDILGYPSIS